MQTYTQLHSILNKDNKKILVTLIDWAKIQLNQQQLSQFQLDSNEFINFYQQLQNSGQLNVSSITKQIDTPSGSLTVIIGSKYDWANQRLNNEKYEFWQAQFAADPSVEYQPEILKG